MDYRMVLRYELEKAIAETGCTLTQLKEKGGSEIGNLSACLRGKPLRQYFRDYPKGENITTLNG